MEPNQKNRLLEKFQRELGQELIQALEDPEIVEIDLNEDGRVWVERLGKGTEFYCTLGPESALAVFGSIAHSLGTTVSHKSPILNGELPHYGCRFNGYIPPIVSNPVFAIRKKASRVFTLSEYVANKTLNESGCKAICEAVRDHKNIIVAGSTGAGKTTLTNAIIAEIVNQYPEQRIIVIEDTDEIQCSSENHVKLRSDETIGVTTQLLLQNVLRANPTRIFIGECRRGSDAMEMLKAWNTGHPGGVCTVHADGAEDALYRVEQMISEISSTPMAPLVGRAVDMVVFVAKRDGVRQIENIVEVLGTEGDGNGGVRYKVASIQ